jgi:hypothetical protein
MAAGVCISRSIRTSSQGLPLDGAKMIWLSYEGERGNALEPTTVPLIYSESRRSWSRPPAVFLVSA